MVGVQKTRVQNTPPPVAAAPSEDQLVITLKRYWREIAVILVSIPVALFVRDTFRDTREKSLDAASELFTRIRNERQELVIKRDEILKLESSDKEEDKKRVVVLRDEVSKLETRYSEALTAFADAKEPYGKLAAVYKWSSPKISQAELESYEWKPVPDDLGKALISEGEAITASRAMIDNGAAALREKAIHILKEVSQSGKALNVLAALTLGRVADSAAEKGLALTTLNGVAAAHPDQAELLKADISRLTPAQ